MPTLETLRIDLPVEMAATVRQAVQMGQYASQNDAVQDAIRHWALERSAPAITSLTQLNVLWQEAIDSHTEDLDFDEVFDRLEAKYVALAEESERT